MKWTILVVGVNSNTDKLTACLAQAENGFGSIEKCKPTDLLKRMRIAPQPQVILLEENSLPLNTSLQQLVACVAKLAKATRILIFGSGEIMSIVAASQAGAQGYIPNNARAYEFEQVLRKAIAGNGFAFPDSLKSLTNSNSAAYLTAPVSIQADLKLLTTREWEIIQLVSQGLTTREISSTLPLSFNTINWYVKRILSKLGLRKRTQLAGYENHQDSLLVQDPTANPC